MEILRSAYLALIAVLQDIAAFLGDVVDWLPAEWPVWVRMVVVFVGLIIILQIVTGNIGKAWRVFLLPWRLLQNFWVLLQSPFGRAEWAGWNDLRREKMFKPHGLFLGQWRKWIFWRKDLYHHGEGHFITIAAPGGGKSVGALIPSLLTCREGSFVVTDPKGELTAITRRHREKHSRVFYLNPFFKEFEDATGLSYPDSGFNPFDTIDNDQNIRARADNFARLLCVTDRKESGSYFQDDGAELLSLFITWMVRHEPAENRNLPYLYELLRTYAEKILEYMQLVDDPLIESEAARFHEMLQSAPQQWQGVISKAQLATKRYVPTTPLAEHTSKSGFNPKLLKSEDVTVYILLPSEHIQTGAPWLNMVIGLLGEAVGRAGKARPVTFLLDELPALGYLPDLRTQMRQYRGAGMRMWLFSQTAAALSSSELYGVEGTKDLFALCDTKQFFSIRQLDTAQEISKMCGEKAMRNRNLAAQGSGVSVATVGIPLIRPEDILKLRKGRQIILRRDTPPIKARLVPYYTRKKWRKITDKNPYMM